MVWDIFSFLVFLVSFKIILYYFQNERKKLQSASEGRVGVPKRPGVKRKPKLKNSQGQLLVRNSYSLPKRELEQLTQLVERLRFTKKINPRMKKSEIVRVGLQLARRTRVDELVRIRERIGILSVGRPTKKSA